MKIALISALLTFSVNLLAMSNVQHSISSVCPKEMKNSQYNLHFPSTEREQLIHKIFLKPFPENGTVKIKMKRPILGITSYIDAGMFDAKKLISDSKLFGSNEPFVILTSRGFLPGERISVLVEADNDYVSNEITLIPFPISSKYVTEKRKVSVELEGILPFTNYKLTFMGWQKEDIVELFSKSGGETSSLKFPMKLGDSFYYSPDLINGKGGKANVTLGLPLTDQRATFLLPWGSDLLPYLKGEIDFKRDLF